MVPAVSHRALPGFLPPLLLACFVLSGCVAQKRMIAEQTVAIDSLMALTQRQSAEISALQDSLQFYDDINSGAYHRRLRQLGDRINKLEYDLATASDDGTTLAVLLADDLFAPASATLTAAGLEHLDALVDTLASPGVREVRIEGHSDNIPIGASLAETYPSNWELAAARAAAVARYFMEEHNLPSERFEVVSYGPAHPVATNTTADGRRQNRRVRIAVQTADLAASPSSTLEP